MNRIELSMLRKKKHKKNNLHLINDIKQAATAHLHARSATEALSHYTKDVVAVSNQKIFDSYESLAEDVNNYYKILSEVINAEWKAIQIRIIDQNTATFTANFTYCFKTIENETIDLSGVWSALFINVAGEWKIRLRHESFVEK
jgi:hypothetical protein